ncbi:hypothetical protein SprV_0702399400 [Sparganum proliferum]
MKRKYYGFHRSAIYKRLLRQRRAYYAAMEEQPIASTSSVANESPELQMPELMPEVSTELPVVAGTVDTVEGRCLTTDLREFCLRAKLSLTTAKDLFQVLRHYHPELPNDPRTLLQTPRTCVSKSLKRGKYVHLGLERGLLDELRLCPLTGIPEVHVQLHIDGMKVFKASAQCLWPILARVNHPVAGQPFVAGVFCGFGKPEPLEDFLGDYVSELNGLLTTGLRDPRTESVIKVNLVNMYSVVEFFNDKSVAVEAEAWFYNSGSVLWPKKHRQRSILLENNQRPPDGTKAYAVKVLRSGLTLQKARQAARRAENTDNLSSSEPRQLGRGKRIRHIRKLSSDSDDEDLPNQPTEPTGWIAPPPILQKRNDFLAEKLMALHSSVQQMQATPSDVVNALQRASSAGSVTSSSLNLPLCAEEAYENFLRRLSVGNGFANEAAGGSKEKKSFMACPLFSVLKDDIPLPPCTFQPVSLATAEKHLKKVRGSTAAGPDGVSPFLLKSCSSQVAPILTHLINMSFMESKIPDAWRTVRITPIPKKPANFGPKSFRPIASSSAMLKLAERVALDIIKPFSSSFSDPLQFAYKAKRSTLDAVALVIHSALKALDKGCREYACALLDYSSAFNTVPRPLLLTKTSACGSPGWVVSWLSDYFTSLTQFVQSGKRKSSTLPNDCGVLQGSILSPRLFFLHTDDLRSPNDCLLVKYADDVVVGHSLKSQTHLRSLKDGLNHVLAWSEENGLLINNQKSVQCIFRLRPSSNPDSSDILPNEVSSSRYLGVTLSSNLSFSLHIESIFIKVRKLLYYIRRLRSYHTPQPLVWRFINACILPLILYYSPVIFPALLKKDLLILKRVLRMLSSAAGVSYLF